MKTMHKTYLVWIICLSMFASMGFQALAMPAPRYTNWSYSQNYRTLVVDGEEFDNYTLFYRNNDTLQFVQRTNGLLCDPRFQAEMSIEDYMASQDENTEYWLQRQAQYYPLSEIIAINWLPWQETKFKEIYTKAVLEKTTYDKSLVAKILADPANNGHAKELLAGKDLASAEKEKPLEAMAVYTSKYVTYRNYDEYKADGGVWLSEPTMKTVTWNTYEEFRDALGIQRIAPKTPSVKISLRFNDPTIYVETNGITEAKTLDVSPWCPRDTTLIPIRGVFEALGATVVWFDTSKEIGITYGDLDIMLKVGSNTAMVNGTAYTMPEPVQYRGDRTVIPLRFISETLGYLVTWTPPDKVEIQSK